MKEVIFIEDNALQRELTHRLYQMFAKSFHGEVTFRTATNWDDGMLEVKTREIDVIILDLTLPPLEATDTIQKLTATSNLPPVVVLTGHEALEPRQPESGKKPVDWRADCILAGADSFMNKQDANAMPQLLCEKCYEAWLRRQRDLKRHGYTS